MPQSDPQISIYRDTITGKHMYSPGDDAPGGAAAAAAAVSAEIKQLRRANMKAKRGGTAAGIAPLKLPQHDMAVRWLERSAAAGNEGKAQASDSAAGSVDEWGVAAGGARLSVATRLGSPASRPTEGVAVA